MSAAPKGQAKLHVLLYAIILVVLAIGVAVARGDLDFDTDPYLDRRGDFLAVLWPEQWAFELADAQDRVDERSTHWRLHAEETALAFAREVMQWPQVARLEVCTEEVAETCAPPGTHFALSRTPGDRPIVVTLRQVGQTGERGVWSVAIVQGGRVLLDVLPGDTIHVGDRLSGPTSLRSGEHENLHGGSSYTNLLGGCGSGGGSAVEVEDGVLEFGPSLARVDCLSSANGVGASISTGERIQEPAAGFVFVALDPEWDDMGSVMDHHMPRDIRGDFVGSKPILDLAAVPVLFAPKPS